MNINERVGIRIKKARLNKKLSREQVARRVGISQQAIEKYEKGLRNIPFIQLVRVCNAMGICITLFLEKEDNDDSLYRHFYRILIDPNKGEHESDE